MTNDKNDFDQIYGETIDEALKTGFLFGHSLNYYEDHHTREELIQKGHSEDLIECASRVLAHFGTTVGAKLGLCPPELWCVRPCADCGVDVDSRIFSGLWRYGVIICEECFDKREAEKKCSVCSSLYDDHAIKDDFRGRCKERYVREPDAVKSKNIFICNWCALTLYNNSKDFLDKRGGSDKDYCDFNSLWFKLGFLKTDEPHYSTQDPRGDLIRNVNRWGYFEEHKGIAFGEKWENYFVTYTGIVLRIYQNPIEIDLENESHLWLKWHQEDPRKLVQIVRVRIRYKCSLAYLEIMVNNPSHRIIDIRNRQNAKTEEAEKVWEGRKIFYGIEKTRAGRPLELKDVSIDILIRLIASLSPRGTQIELSLVLGVDRSTLHRYITGRLGTDWETVLNQSRRFTPDQAYQELPLYYQVLLNRDPQ
jgi:hypothetical protein